MKKISIESPRARARLAVWLAVGALGVLALVFFRTQVLRSGADVLVQQGNRLRAVPLPAARGTILDRNGVVLAGSQSATALILMPAPPDSIRARLDRIAMLLDLPDARRERLELLALSPPRPLVVTDALSPADVAMLVANRRFLPGVLLEAWPQRTYPAGNAAASVVGHVGSAPWPPGTGEDLAGSGAGRAVGRAGLELAFDSVLSGDAGLRYVEMDEAGGIVGSPTATPYRQPQPGAALRTRVDAALQRHLAEVLPTRGRAAAVVIEIASGDVLALYSHPAHVPGRVGEEDPPENAAIALVDQPGAVFHTITAALALESERIDLERPQSVPCRGGMRYGERYFRCWDADGHGQLALAGAIREGCDVYFHQIGLRLGLEALLEAGSRLGLGRPTGLELPEERPGLYPGTVAELAGRLGRAPNPSDALDLAAGHGLNESTLIRMTHAYATIAGGGQTSDPRLTPMGTREASWRIALTPERTSALLDMLGAVTAPGAAGSAAGTAVRAGGGRIRGQVSRAREQGTAARPTGWFVGVAGPAAGPDRIAVGVIVERSPSDDVPAALAGRIADYYLRNGRSVTEPAAPDTSTLSAPTVSSS